MGIAALALAGCGGSDDDGGSSDGGSDAPATTVTAADEAAIAEVSVKLEKAARARNGKALCDLLQPGLIGEAFGSKAKCAKQVTRAIAQPGLKDLQIDEITATETGASASFKNAPGRDLPLVKIDGKWYIDLSGSISPDATVPSQ